MKSPFKFALSVLSFGLAAAAPAVLADDATPPPPPAAPADAPSAPTVAAPAAGDQPADQPPPPPRRRGRRDPLKMLTEKLSLTQDQQDKVADLLKSQHEQGKAIRDDTTLSDDDRRSKGRDLMKSTHDQIRALLTADQQKTFDAMRPMRGGPGGGGKKSDNN